MDLIIRLLVLLVALMISMYIVNMLPFPQQIQWIVMLIIGIIFLVLLLKALGVKTPPID